MGILKNYKAIGKIPPPIPDDISDEARFNLVVELLESGDPKRMIADYVGLSHTTIYNYARKAKEEFVRDLASTSFAEIFAGSLKEIEDQIVDTQDILKAIKSTILTVEEDEITGIPTTNLESTSLIREYNDTKRSLTALIKHKNEIMLALTLKQKDGSPNVYGTISDKNIEHKEEVVNLAHEDEVNELVKLLTQEQPKLKNV